MIVCERKPMEELVRMIGDSKTLLLAGCNACTAVCFAGGEREVEILASQLRLMRRDKLEVAGQTVARQCDYEFVDELAENVAAADVVLSMACGAGVQAMAERFPDARIVPALNTVMFGMTEKMGVWGERCVSCGDCVLESTAGLCPLTRCAKGLLNGPCGGAKRGMCEVSKDIPCVWDEIYDRLKARGELARMAESRLPKDWSLGSFGVPKTVVREDLLKESELMEKNKK